MRGHGRNFTKLLTLKKSRETQQPKRILTRTCNTLDFHLVSKKGFFFFFFSIRKSYEPDTSVSLLVRMWERLWCTLLFSFRSVQPRAEPPRCLRREFLFDEGPKDFVMDGAR